jgi:cobalt-zinc-cadmium resistance protein CzcA
VTRLSQLAIGKRSVTLLLAAALVAAGSSSIAAELGTVVIGALISSTFLTLLVIPAIYSLVDGLKRRVTNRLRAAPATAPVGEAAAG